VLEVIIIYTSCKVKASLSITKTTTRGVSVNGVVAGGNAAIFSTQSDKEAAKVVVRVLVGAAVLPNSLEDEIIEFLGTAGTRSCIHE